VSSAAYALLHFFQPGKSPVNVTWSSGLELLPQMLRGFIDPNLLVPGLITLALVGTTLALAYQRTGNLWFSIGLHAGWVFWLKSYNTITDSVEGAARHFWGSGKFYDGWMALMLMTAVTVIVWNLSPQDRALVGSEKKRTQPDIGRPQGCASFSAGAPCPPGTR
jgi:membrane protease YdiL (CAAX protease family)